MKDGLTRRASLGALVSASASAGVALPGKRVNFGRAAVSDPIFAPDREQLSLSDPSRQFAYLLEEGRAGLFKWHPMHLTPMISFDPKQAIYVPLRNDPTGAQGAWKRIVEGDIHLEWFGAKFDVGDVASISDASDDSDAWEAALAYLNVIGGGTLRLPHGASKVTRELVVPYNNIRIVGTGTRKVYPGRFHVGTMSPSTLVPVHAYRNAFRFVASKEGDGSFCAENFNLATLEQGQMPKAAFGWDTQHSFLYGFTFRRIGVHGFTSAFDSYKGVGTASGAGAVGAVLVDDCVINRNRWIARTLDGTQFNGFHFTNNKAGQNGYHPGSGGIAVSGHDLTVENNILEGMRDPIFAFGAYRDISVKGNYFEGNVGMACVRLRSIRGPYSIGPNNYSVLDYQKVDHKVLLEFCGLGACIDPYWPHVVHKLPAPLTGATPPSTLKNAIHSADYGFCRMDSLDGTNWSTRPRVVRSAVAQISEFQRETNPLTGLAMPVQRHRTSGLGYAAHRCAIKGSAGQWVAMSWLFRREPDGGSLANPYVSMKVNGGELGGSRDYVAFGFSEVWRDGDWCLMTTAIRLQTAMSWLLLLLYPHGAGAAEGRYTNYLPPTVYTVDDINDVSPFVDNRLARSATAAPATGEWDTGDILYNSAPAKGSTLFVCTQGGSPGTWVAT